MATDFGEKDPDLVRFYLDDVVRHPLLSRADEQRLAEIGRLFPAVRDREQSILSLRFGLDRGTPLGREQARAVGTSGADGTTVGRAALA